VACSIKKGDRKINAAAHRVEDNAKAPVLYMALVLPRGASAAQHELEGDALVRRAWLPYAAAFVGCASMHTAFEFGRTKKKDRMEKHASSFDPWKTGQTAAYQQTDSTKPQCKSYPEKHGGFREAPVAFHKTVQRIVCRNHENSLYALFL
jgi:hypothetical protein